VYSLRRHQILNVDHRAKVPAEAFAILMRYPGQLIERDAFACQMLEQALLLVRSAPALSFLRAASSPAARAVLRFAR
jgi:hypothetical protein